MKSAYKIAKEIGITSQAVYKRMTPEFLAQFEGHIFQGSEKSKRILFDEIGEQVLKAAFKKGEQQPDQPADRVDQPADQVDQPANLVDQPADQVDQPANLVDQPANSVDQPNQKVAYLANLVDQPADRVDQPANSVDQPANSVDQPADSVDQPADRVDQPADRVDQPADRVDQPADSVDQLADSVDQLADSVDQPADRVNQPANSVDQPANRVDQPANLVDQPADRVDQPANRVNPLISQLQTENQYLRKAVTNLSDELKIEREHGRSQAVKLSALMDRYSKITENQQILLGREQGLNNPNLLLDGAQDKTAVSQKTVMEKVGFWHRLFGKKNSAKI